MLSATGRRRTVYGENAPHETYSRIPLNNSPFSRRILFGKPVRLSGRLSTLVQPVEVEDNATVPIEYESGIRGMVDVL